MKPRAFLKKWDGSFCPLSPKGPGVGREGSGLPDELSIDQQHAILEYSEREDCYILQDMNSPQGTYVNDVRVQNAAVRLSSGDVIRFGSSGPSYELCVDSSFSISCPPVQQKVAWNHPLTIIGDQPSHLQPNSSGLPQLLSTAMEIPLYSRGHQQCPHPPSLRSRPISAGSNRRATWDRSQINSNIFTSSVAANKTNSSLGGFSSQACNSPSISGVVMPLGSSVTDQLSRLQEKDKKIAQLTELNRTTQMENEILLKDEEIQRVQQQVCELQEKLKQSPAIIVGTDAEVTDKLLYLERQLEAKTIEVNSLKEQLDRLQVESAQETQLQLKLQLNETILNLNSVKGELEKVKKDKSITTGLVTQMQRDLSSKDVSISKLTREIESLKRDLLERDTHISSMAVKFSQMNDNTKASEERDAREKELMSLRQKFKTKENKVEQLEEMNGSLQNEVQKLKEMVTEERELKRKLQSELQRSESEFQDMQRTERVVRVDLEQSNNQLERFRNRIIKVAFSKPLSEMPAKEISDDELMELLKSLITDQIVVDRQIKEMKDEVKHSQAQSEGVFNQIAQLKDSIIQSLCRLKERGLLTNSLKQEIETLKSFNVDKNISGIKDVFIQLISHMLSWQQNIEDSLEECGVNVKVSTDDPSKHLKWLYEKWRSSIQEKEYLSLQLQKMEEDHKVTLQLHTDSKELETRSRIAEAIEKTKLEGEKNMNEAINDIQNLEEEKQRELVRLERIKVDELQATIDQLRQSLIQSQNETHEKLEEANKVLTELENNKEAERGLHEQVKLLQQQNTEQEEALRIEKSQNKNKWDEELAGYKEQLKQHSITICTLEGKLKKVSERNQDYQDKISSLEKDLYEMRTRPPAKPVLPPKPKIIVQKPTQEILAMEQLTVVLRRDMVELQKQLQEKNSIILGLRRDLAGASARLSDVTGELSEASKQELEESRELLSQHHKEVAELRIQLAKLSKIIDRQTEENKKVENELSKEKSLSLKYKNSIEDQTQKIINLENHLHFEKEEKKQQTNILDHEGRITSELTALGAQCRGERHEQVIVRQREALAELRARVKTMDQTKTSVPHHSQALQQVIMLKKELAQMRSNQENGSVDDISLEREVNKARGLTVEGNHEAEMERSAHRETMSALEASEISYLSLLRVIASSLKLQDIDGLRSMAHLPRDEREKLQQEREKSSELMVGRIKVLMDRLSRKDELLNDYEVDLGKLRKAEELAKLKEFEAEAFMSGIQTRVEEADYLRESLNRSNKRLEQEKRLNSAIKQRKTFHLENEQPLQNLMPRSHHCPPEDIMGKAHARKKQQSELVKKRNYEIKALKKELLEKDKELKNTEKRLCNMETGLSFTRSSMNTKRLT